MAVLSGTGSSPASAWQRGQHKWRGCQWAVRISVMFFSPLVGGYSVIARESRSSAREQETPVWATRLTVQVVSAVLRSSPRPGRGSLTDVVPGNDSDSGGALTAQGGCLQGQCGLSPPHCLARPHHSF